MIKVHDKQFEPYISAADIAQRIAVLGAQINLDYLTQRPLFIVILNGSFVFAADLVRHLSFDVELSFVKLSSYHGLKSSGEVITYLGLDVDIAGRHLVIVEDIIDTGKTLHSFIKDLGQKTPASVKIVSLLHKPTATIYPISIDYCGFSIPDKFVVGYGLDYDGLGRNLPEIYQLAE